MPVGAAWFAYHRDRMLARLGRVLVDDGPMGRSVAVILLASAWVATWRPQVDPDAWWHMSIGKAVLAGGIPAVEPFSWLTAGDRFVAHSWLWDVLMAVAYEAGGATGTSLLVVPITAGIVAAAWALIGIAAPGIPPIGRAALVVLGVVASLTLWAPRSQTLDVLFVLGMSLAIARYLRLGAHGGLLALPLLAVLWANLHGSAVLGMVAMLAAGLLALPIGARWGVWPRRPGAPLALASLASLVAVMLNPYGPALLLYPFDRVVASAFSFDIIEWRAPDFRAPELLVARVLIASLLLLAAAWPPRRRDPFLLLTAAAWTFAALGAVRFLPIAALVVVAAAAPAIGPSIARWLGVRAVGVSDPEAPALRPAPFLATAAIASLAILAVGWSFITPSAQAAAIAHRQPAVALDVLEGQPCAGRILPAYGWAGYVFEMTGREVGAYGNSAEGPLREQAAVEAVTSDPRPWLDGHAVDIALMPVTGPLSHWLTEADGWRLEYRDAQASIHVRSDRPDCQL